MLYEITNIPLEEVGTVNESDILNAITECELNYNGPIAKKSLTTETTFDMYPKLMNARQFVGLGTSCPTLVTKTENSTNTVFYAAIRGFYYASSSTSDMNNYVTYKLYYNSKTGQAVGFSCPTSNLTGTVKAFIENPDTKLVFSISLTQAVNGGLLAIPNNKLGSTPKLTITYSNTDGQIRLSNDSWSIYGSNPHVTNTGYKYAPFIEMRRVVNGQNENNSLVKIYKDQTLAAKLNEISSQVEAMEERINKTISQTSSVFVSR